MPPRARARRRKENRHGWAQLVEVERIERAALDGHSIPPDDVLRLCARIRDDQRSVARLRGRYLRLASRVAWMGEHAAQERITLLGLALPDDRSELTNRQVMDLASSWHDADQRASEAERRADAAERELSRVRRERDEAREHYRRLVEGEEPLPAEVATYIAHPLGG